MFPLINTIFKKLISKCPVTFLLICCMLVLLSTFVKAQEVDKKMPDSLLRGKTRLSEIMQVVRQYYKINKPVDKPGEESDYQHWLRWEKWMGTHLDANGEFTNIAEKTKNAVNDIEQRFGKAAEPTAAYRVEGASPNSTNSVGGFWSPVGPFTNNIIVGVGGLGRIDRIAFHPTNPNILFAGSSAGGLWKTTDGGNNWNCITNSLPLLAVSGIAINYNNPNIIYILTGDGDSHRSGYFVPQAGYSANSDGVYKTTDGGVSWFRTGTISATPGWVGRKMAMDPNDPNTLMVAASDGLYKTSDACATWTQVLTGEHFDVVYKPGSSTTVYASRLSKIEYSNTSGNAGSWSFSFLNFIPSPNGRVDLAVSPANSNYVYAVCGPGRCNLTGQTCDGSGYFFGGIFKSTNSGANFTRQCNSPNILGGDVNGQDGGDQSDYDLGITVSPSDPEYVVTGGATVWRSAGSNGGSVMIAATTYSAGPNYIHPDCHNVSYNLLNGMLYAANDGGLYKSANNGQTWTTLTDGLATTEIYHMKGWDSNADGYAEGPYLAIGCQDNGIKYRSAFNTIWNHIMGADGFYTSFAPNSPNNIWFSANKTTLHTTNGGVSSTSVLNVDFFPSVIVDPGNANNIYVGYQDTLYKSINNGSSFFKLPNIKVEDELVVCPSNNARLYGVASGYSAASTNNGAGFGAWSTLSSNAGWPAGGLPVTDIKPRPTNDLEVFTSFGGYANGNKIYRSTNAGASWSNYSGSLPNVPFHSLAIGNDGVYAGSDIGMFFRAHGSADWQPFYNGLPRVPITDIVLNDNGTVYASTFGRGVWYSDQYSACTAAITVSGTLNGAYSYQASQSASVTSFSNGGEGTQVFVKAGDSVIGKPGFEVKAGSYFRGFIGPCGSGGIPTIVTNPTDSINKVKAENDFIKTATQINGIGKDGYLEIVLKEPGILKAEINFTDGSSTELENKLYPPGVYWLPFKVTDKKATITVSINEKPLTVK